MIKVGIAGCCGRMGQMLINAVKTSEETVLSGVYECSGHPEIGNKMDSGDGVTLIIEDSLEKIINNIDVLIDFTSIESTLNAIKIIADNNKSIVIGTTGLNQEQINELKSYSDKIKIVFAPNMSMGVNLLFKLVKDVAKVIGNMSDIEIVEYHHNQKKDAPSGTAVKLAENIAYALNRDLNEVMVTGRKGLVGARKKNEIGVMAVRAGDIVGEHTVTFAMEGERVELIHKAHSRLTFAKGSVQATIWLKDKPNGFYNMNDVLGI